MATKKKPITIAQYCALAGIKPPSVSYRIDNKQILPGILRYQYNDTTRQYELFRDGNVKDEQIPLYFRSKVTK